MEKTSIAADLHLHGRFSRATSKDITVSSLEKYAKIKGIGLLGTGDFTHPKWLSELKAGLKEDGTGFLKSKTGFPFVLQTEVANIFSQDGKLRKVHNIILAKNFGIVDQINEHLSKKGNLSADGRPIFGKYSCIQLVEDMMKISKEIEIIPAHVYTPWFSIFGSMSGFDSVEECFQDKAHYIHALETGLSSDPEMNWRISKLDRYTLISNSDSHSFWPWRMGRECNLLEIEPSYAGLLNAIRTKKGFKMTIEVDPGYGKYHFDGHRNCNVCLKPSDSLKNKNICPKCGKSLTIGVLHRVEELADRPEGYKPKNAVEFKRIIPLHEILAASIGAGIATQKTWDIYNKLVGGLGNEMNILLNATEKELTQHSNEKLAALIIKNRNGEIEILPGYDGEYGRPIISKKEEKKQDLKALREATEIEGESISARKKKSEAQMGLKKFF